MGLIRQVYRRLQGPDGDEDLRVAMVKMIGHLEHPTDEALDFLEEVLRDQEKRWPRREREKYGKGEIPRNNSPILAAAREAFQKFGAISVPTILRLSGDLIFSVEDRSRILLEKIVAPGEYVTEGALVPLLVESLKSPDAALKEGARRLFYEIDFEAAAPYLLGALEEEDVELRRLVLTIFDHHMSECDQFYYSSRILTGVMQRLEDNDPEVRKKAAEILGGCGVQAKNALPLLVAMRLNDPEESCRVKAKEAMEKIEEGAL